MTPPPPADTRKRRTNLGAKGLLLAMVSLLALFAAIVILVILEQRQERADQQVANTLEVRSTIHEVRGLLANAETGVRGFLLSGEEAFLEPYETARLELGPALDKLTNLVADTGAQTGRIERVREAAQLRLDQLDQQLEPMDEATHLDAMESGRAVMDGIRADLAAMEATEDQLLAERRASSEQTRGILAAFIPTAGLIGLLGLIATVGFATGLTRRISRITANATRLGTGEPMVPIKRTSDDLGLLAEAIFDAAGLLRSREDALRAAREFLEYLIEEGPVVMFRERADQTRELTYISPNAERVLGIPPESATGRHRFFASMLAPEHRKAFDRGARAAVEGQVDGWYGEYETAAGHWLAVDIKVHRAAHEPPHLLGYVIDITDRMEASEAARAAELNYYALFEGIPTGILSTTSGGRIVDANRATARMLGFDSSDDLMAEIADIGMIYANTDQRRAFLETLRDQGAVTNYETRFQRRDGTTIDVSINARMVSPTDDGSAGIEGTVIDVTDRKRAEFEMRRAQAEADRANQAKSVFLSRMSHELRTPLNSIIGFGQLLELSDPPLDPTARESVTHILKAGRHLLDLIDEVLDIARVEAGRLNISLEPTDIDETLSESIDLIRPMAAARSIQIGIPPEGCQTYVLADRQRLKQVFLNLLSNAVKYNRVGGTVQITCVTVGPDLAVSFADTGPGIAPAHLERLFTPFDRLDAEGTDEEGTGLGLVLSRHLLEAMASSLTVESEQGRGSTFTVTVPRTEPVEIDETAHPTHVFGASSAQQVWKVIYIEDNLANLRLIERILDLRSDVDLEAAMQGRLGIELVREHVPDLVLLDLNLPDMDGRDVLLEIRSDPATAHIPVLVISADASPGQVQRLLDAGANGYLTKPVNVVEFLNRVDELLS